MAEKKSVFDKAGLTKLYGAQYSEAVRVDSLEYLVAKGVASGLKQGGFNTEIAIAAGLEKGAAPSAISRAQLVASIQIRDMLALNCQLMEDILREAKR